jgi:two-component system, LytTR family, sensor histidine kinase AlgZ
VHGIAGLPEGGTVRLRAILDTDRVQISIENSVDPEAAPSRKGGLGLKNVRQRIEARYPQQASLRTTPEEDSFRIDISIPAEFVTATAPVAKQTSAASEASRVKVERS